MTRARWVLLIQLVFFLGWGVWLVQHHDSGVSLWLETSPVDPRDLLSGNYIALRYTIQSPANEACKMVLRKENYNPAQPELWVRLNPGKDFLLQDGRSLRFAEIDWCIFGEPTAGMLSPPNVWARARVVPWGETLRLEFDIERFYVSETSPLRNAFSGTVAARVSVDAEHRLHLQELVPVMPRAVLAP